MLKCGFFTFPYYINGYTLFLKVKCIFGIQEDTLEKECGIYRGGEVIIRKIQQLEVLEF